MTVVLHDGRSFDLVTRQPGRGHDSFELVLEAADGSAAGVAQVHLEPGRRAEVTVLLHQAPSADEAGTVLLAEAAELAARHGAVELVAAHAPGDRHADAVLAGVGLGYADHGGRDEAIAVIDLRPLQSWRALATASA